MSAESRALMAALQFTPADLDANRQGRLSRSQAARIRSQRRRNLALAAALFGVFVIGATLCLYAGQGSDNGILTGAGSALVVMNALLVGLAGRGSMRASGDLRAGGVECLCGEVTRVLRRGRQGDSYLLRLDEAELRVTKDIFRSFAHERRYRIYRSVGTRMLLSAEAQ